MENEKALILEDSKKKSNPISDPSISTLPSQKVLDITESHHSAKQRKLKQEFADRQSKRTKDLSHLIQLDFAIYDIFELTPMNEYELYVRNYGSHHSTHSITQTNEDQSEVDIQTDDWYVNDRWTQNPPHQLIDYGIEPPSLPWMTKGKTERQKSSKTTTITQIEETASHGPRLGPFLERSSRLIESLLDESTSPDYVYDEVNSHGELFTNSRSFKTFSFLAEYPVYKIDYYDDNAKYILITWNCIKERSLLGVKSILIVYKLNDLQPFRVLICYPKITCTYISPDQPNIIMAGTKDGSIQLWDLRESETLHMKNGLEPIEEYQMRWPSYINDGDLSNPHTSAIVTLHHSNNHLKTKTHERNSFQILSIDQSGYHQTWIVLLQSKESSEPKLLQSHINLIAGDGWMIEPPNKSDFIKDNFIYESLFFKTGKYILASDNGIMYHYSKFKDHCSPKKFLNGYTDLPNSLSVTCLSCSFFNDSLFLVGYDNGLIDLFTNTTDLQLMNWNLDGRIVQIQWSPHRPSVFYVLVENGLIYIYDLMDTFIDYCHLFDVTNENNWCTSFVLPYREGTSTQAALVLGMKNGQVLSFDIDQSLTEQLIDEETEFSQTISSLGISDPQTD
ncbi:hypothetical protein BC833DRAFT_426711 [Globomyces pollinis-pini]|nr:hypothetical protein BC833DRAFT_426711 [Globomyces pollinis-pini]